MNFNTCVDLCNHHHKQDTEQFHHPSKKKPRVSLYSDTFFPPITCGNCHIDHCSSVFLRMTYTWNHTVYHLWKGVCFTLNKVTETHLGCQ